MDSLKFTPKDFHSSYADDTYNVEGYETAVDEIRSEYPEETKTEEQQKLEDLFDPDSEINQGLFELNELDLGEDNNLQIGDDFNLEAVSLAVDKSIQKINAPAYTVNRSLEATWFTTKSDKQVQSFEKLCPGLNCLA